MVSVLAYRSSGPTSSPACYIILILDCESRKCPRYTQRLKGGGIGAAVDVSRTIPRYVSCSQSRTIPMYIAFWQLHSHLYLENPRVIWDSVPYII